MLNKRLLKLKQVHAPVVERAQHVSDQAPAVRKALTETGIAAGDVAGTGRGGRITKEDVANHQTKPAIPAAAPLSVAIGERIEKRVPMTRFVNVLLNVCLLRRNKLQC